MDIVRRIAIVWLLVLGPLAACTTGIPGPIPVKELRTKIADDRNCSAKEPPYRGYDVANHIFQIDSRGRVIPTTVDSKGTEPEDKSVFPETFRNIASAFRDYSNYLKGHNKNSSPNILLYFNGGLTAVRAIQNQAIRQVPCMISDGYFPIFMAWPTGAIDTYAEQTVLVRNGRRQNRPDVIDVPAHLIGDLGQGIACAPITYYHQFRRYVAATFFPGQEFRTKADRLRWQVGNEKRVTSEKNLLVELDADKKPALGPDDFYYAATLPARALITPFTDSVGSSAWENMVRRTRTGVHQPIEFDLDERSTVEDEIKHFPRGLGGFAKFFHMLERCYQQAINPAKPNRGKNCSESEIFKNDKQPNSLSIFANFRLTLIGHSMGTIALNELMPIFSGLPYGDIVYMASAAGIRDSQRTLVPLLRNQPRGDKPIKFYNLMLHPMNDAQELVLKGAAPSGSLLAWIDEMYEDPRTMLDRTFGKWRNVRAAKHVFDIDAQNHMLFRIFNWRKPTEEQIRRNRHCHPVTHGGFNEDRMAFWRPQFWGADRTGWQPKYVPSQITEREIDYCLKIAKAG